MSYHVGFLSGLLAPFATLRSLLEAGGSTSNSAEKTGGDDTLADGSTRDGATGRSRARVETQPTDLGRDGPGTCSATGRVSSCWGSPVVNDGEDVTVRYRLTDIVPITRNRVLDTVSDGVFVVDREHRIIDANLAGRRLLADVERDPIGERVEDLFDSRPELADPYRELTAARDEADRELALLGGHYHVWVTPIERVESA